jgi:hypothetical protein
MELNSLNMMDLNISSLSQYSPVIETNIQNAVLSGDLSMNIVGELNREDENDINSEYSIRKKLYENKDDFYKNEDLIETTDQEIIDISNTVKKGQLMLKSELLKYSVLKDDLEHTNNLQSNFHDQIMLMRKSLLLLRELNMDDIIDYKEDIDNIHKNLEKFDKKVCTHIANQSETLREEYSISFKKLLQLKDVYKILKNSDITFACPICMTNQVESFLIPCGHTYCPKCIVDIKQRCYICRQTFTKICSLYFN